MAAERFVFEDWTDGEYGDKPPESVSFKAFTGSNVWRYRNGCLGPRPGLAEVPVTGNVAGRVWGFFAPTVSGARLVMVIDDKVYRANSDFDIELVEFATGSPLVNAPTSVVPFTVVELGHQIYFSVPGHNLYEMDCLDDTIVELLVDATTSVGPTSIKAHGERLYFGGQDEIGRLDQVFYSEAADFTNLPSVNFLSFGYGIATYLMEPLGNNLIVGTRLTWYALVGGTISGAIRTIYTSAAPGKQSTTATHEGLIWFWAYSFGPNPENGGENGRGRLAFTNGTIFDTDEYRHLTMSGLRFGLVAPKVDAIVFSSDERRLDGEGADGHALIRLNDVWAYHDFEVDTTGPVANVTETTRAVFVGGDRGTSHVYSINVDASAGSYELTTDAGTITIPVTATLAEVQDLVYFGITGGCDVTAGVAPIDFVLTFTGSNQGLDMNCTIDDTLATGGAATVTGADTVTGAASEANYYQLRMDLERPGQVGGDLENPGDASDTPIDAYFHTKVVRHPQGREMCVRKVLVEFQKWDSGLETNSFTVEVRTYGRNANDGLYTQTQPWSEDASETTAGADGEQDVHQFNFGAHGYGTGFQIGITDIVSVAIRRITVEVDVTDGRQEGA
jgi:hypothetical protein